jgi:hypothetical protein
MYVFMHGADCTNYDSFSRTIEEHAMKETSFLIPSLVIRHNLEQRTESLNHWHGRLYWHERKLGIRFDDLFRPDPAKLDYAMLSKDLNAANTRLAYAIWACKATDKQLDFMDSVARRYRAQAVRQGLPDDQAIQVETLMNEAHAHLRAWNEGILDRAEYLSKRAQALVQTIYSGIAQRDSSTSLSLAATSTKLAETSQDIAIATSRDSAAMRVIAAITIFFLPATFTAVSMDSHMKESPWANIIQTFFSTTFFEFNADLNGQVYSSWLWLYFVVTIGLTAAVVVGTWFMWRTKEKQVDKRFMSEKYKEKEIFTQAYEGSPLTFSRPFEVPGTLSPRQGNISAVSLSLRPDELTQGRIYDWTRP